ncbi:MAG: hypothetical protein DMF59_12470 [Acidobacteria bacterium]|nr:MAG: hypothetical protein DMF59_12470 [Acidobacteriota bacterium]
MRLKAIVIGCLAMGVAVSAAHARGMTECTMKYNLKGWSAFYKTAAGTGTIRCDNGQKANVRLSSRGGGLTAGKTEIRDGMGYFTRVSSIDELFGRYDTASAAAAAGKAASAQALVKDNIRLSLTGRGKGVELGLALGRFTITRR